MEHWLYYLGCIGAVTVATLLIWWWNRGACKRRFDRAFPKTEDAFWTTEHAPFLKIVERAYRLPEHWAKRISPSVTPMALYLTLYPSHCIYDAHENERFLSEFAILMHNHMWWGSHFSKKTSLTESDKETLNKTFGELVSEWWVLVLEERQRIEQSFEYL